MDSNLPPSFTGERSHGVQRRDVLKGMAIGAVAGVGFTGSASAHEAVGTPVFCGCQQLCVCVDGNADVLMAKETDDGFVIGFIVDENELDPYPQGKPRFTGDFCLDTADDDVPDGLILGLQVSGTRWVNPNACAQAALNAEQEQLDSNHPRPPGDSGVLCEKPPCDSDLSIVRLPPLSESDPNGQAFGINDEGTVVGGSSSGSQFHAVRWPDHDTIADLGTLRENDDGFSRANAVSNEGTIVGEADSSLAVSRAFRWTETGGMEDLGTTFEEDEDSSAHDVNDSGTIVGVAGSPGHAFRWTKEGGSEDLGTLQEDDNGFSSAYGIADDGTIVGMSTTEDFEAAFVWTNDDGMRPLEHLSEGPSFARDVNNDHVVVGSSQERGSLGSSPVKWDDETLAPLEMLPQSDEDEENSATAINDEGTIVGINTAVPGPVEGVHAVRWIDDAVEDLGSLDGDEGDSHASDINARGDVAGSSDRPGEGRAAVVWKSE